MQDIEQLLQHSTIIHRLASNEHTLIVAQTVIKYAAAYKACFYVEGIMQTFLHNHASYILASCFYAENSHIFNTFTWTWPDFFSLLCSFLFAALGYPFTNCCVHTYHHLHVNYRLSPPREWPEPATFYHCARILAVNIPEIYSDERYRVYDKIIYFQWLILFYVERTPI